MRLTINLHQMGSGLESCRAATKLTPAHYVCLMTPYSHGAPYEGTCISDLLRPKQHFVIAITCPHTHYT
ncbi:hypothetical protein DSO57_1034309 [Entomophthora muscae]|uniref:Uncharacterized protein n=1 Tax=Entomophthora muscae TaxID=34485 RepID=A0ACC2T0D0_9FUNG|nr:hypothetical protein DSO57_1034309 [Entomophthora muscae]